MSDGNVNFEIKTQKRGNNFVIFIILQQNCIETIIVITEHCQHFIVFILKIYILKANLLHSKIKKKFTNIQKKYSRYLIKFYT